MLLDVKNLSISFKTSKGILHAVRDLSFSLSRGETLGVVGESGCGKSITNLALMGLLPDTATVSADQIKFEDSDLQKVSERSWQSIRGGAISMIFQDPMSALNPCFTVGFQIMETLKIHTDLDHNSRFKRSIELLEQVGIPAAKERMKTYPHELSGGMSQRVMIAMAIACSPKLLVADEPTTALDVTIQDQILKLLKDLQKENNMAMILVTHDLGVVAQNADRINVMYAGELVETGSAKQIIEGPLHPYTKGLLDSLPGQTGKTFRSKLPIISGMVPNLLKRPIGCQFAPRCIYREDKCMKEKINEINFENRSCFCLKPIS